MPEDAEFDAPAQPAPKPRPAKPVAEKAPPVAEKQEKPAETAPIVALVERSPTEVLASDEKLAELYTHIEGEIETFQPVLDTGVGRKAIASLAFKITRTKTAIDEAGKELNRALREKIDAVDERRRTMRTRLDELADKARLPLTEWEAAEEARVKALDLITSTIARLSKPGPLDTAADVGEAITELTALTIDAEIIGEEPAAQLDEKCNDALADLILTRERLARAEEEAAELVRLRQEREAQEAEIERLRQADLARQAQQEASERRQQEEAAQREADAQRKAEQEQERLQAAEERAKADGERAANAKNKAEQLARLAARVESAKTIEALNDVVDECEFADFTPATFGNAFAELAAERNRILTLARQAVAALEQQAEAEADAAHRRKVNTAIRAAFIDAGMDKDKAGALVLKIAAGNFPGLAIDYRMES